ncbi:hypothetical protein niasHT_011417 [Heterodera trifolii]|uniref:Proteasome subunit beta n=1 Tax=Heterodera trifolii TaxID=157864 RepID=A0ABD2IKV3_9BILA
MEFSSTDYLNEHQRFDYQILPKVEYTGTTLVGMECVGGIVVATDSRTSSGTYISNRATDKITMLNERIVILRAGSQADTQALADIVMYYAEAHAIMDEEDEITVRNVANYARKMHYNYRGQLNSTFLVAGYDSINKGQLYVIPGGGYTTRHPYYTSGSGSSYIREYLQNQWKEDMEGEAVRKILKKAVFEAQRRDGASGGLIHTAIINAKGISRKSYRPDKEDFPTISTEKFYPNLPEHILQPSLVTIERMET